MLTRLKKIIELSKPRFLTFGLTILFEVSLAGLVCGTFAWYSYATRAGFTDYHGTTVSDMGYLEIGLVCDKYLYDYADYNLQMDTSVLYTGAHKFIYWSKGTTLEAKAINYVVHANGYASTVIEPTTTGSNDLIEQNGFNLYRKPTWNNGYPLDSTGYAFKNTYVKLQFVFRSHQSEDGAEQFGNDVYLVNCRLVTSNDEITNGQIHKAVRFHINNKRGSYIVSPSSEEGGTNNVGGILDLDLNGYYDYNDENRETVYGEYEGTYSYESSPRSEDTNVPKQDRTSFVANHKKGIYALDQSSFTPKTVSYDGLSKLTSREYPIAVSDSNFNGLSYGEIDVYLEGWDPHVVDQEQESAFNLDLSFSS